MLTTVILYQANSVSDSGLFFKAVTNSREKKDPQQTQDIQDKRFHAPLETKGVFKVQGELRGL